MDMRNPVRSVTWALTKALEQDLLGVESVVAQGLVGRDGGPPLCRRPTVVECSVVMFTQAWRGTELGFGDEVDAAIEAETVIVTGPEGDACVYASTQLLYKVRRPNRRFFLDVAAQRMRGKALRAQYEGRDSSDQEAFDYELAGALARVCGALGWLAVDDATRVASALRACIADVEGVTQRQHVAAAPR